MSFFSWIWDNIVGPIGKYLSDFLNHWLQAIVYSIGPLTDLIRYEINQIIGTLADTIHKINVSIEEAKFHLSQAIQKYYNTTAGFWVIILGFAAAVVVVPAIVKWAAAQLAKIGFFTWLKGAELAVKSWSGWATINTLIEANRLAQILFANWRTIWTGIYQDVSGIAGDIGLGIGSISAVITSVKGMLVTINSTMGADEVTAETDALGRMSDYLNNLANNFNHYAENPQNIWNDLWEKVILPKQKQIRAYYSSLAGKVDSINTKIVALEKLPDNFLSYQASIQKLLGIQLSKQQETIEKDVFKKVSDAIDTYNTQIADRIDAVKKEVKPLNDAIIKHDKEIQKTTTEMNTLFGDLGSLSNLSSYDQLVAWLGTEAPTQLGYLSGKQSTTDVKTFINGVVLGAGLEMGTVTEAQFQEYINTDAGFKPPFVSPLV